MMRRASLIVAFGLILAACSQPFSDSGTIESVERPPSTWQLVDAPGWSPTVDQRPVYEGFGSLTTQPHQLVAQALHDLEVYDSVTASQAGRTLPATTILGTTTVLTVVDRPSADWVEVLLPIRPNGSTGFVKMTDVEIYAVAGRIEIDLSDRELTYILDGKEILTTAVAIGSNANPTPTGVFFVTDSVTLANPNSPWGPHALGLSARSETITEYNGGDGIIGIHGTNNPSSIGKAASLGCVRLPNELITMLHRLVPIGTPVEIRA